MRRCIERGHEVWVYDNLSAGHRAAVPAGRLVVGDLADAPCLNRTLADHAIEAAIHFAAFTAVREPARYFQNNLVNTLNLLEALRRHGVWRCVFSSTAATCGTPQVVPVVENTSQLPINPYGRGKRMVEQVLADYAVAYGWGYAALR